VPTANLELAPGLTARMYSSVPKTDDELFWSRNAMFRTSLSRTGPSFTRGSRLTGLIDDLMAQVPGKDGYGVNLTDTLEGRDGLHFDEPEQTLNAGH